MLANLFISSALAQDAAPRQDFKPLKLTGTADVIKVIDPQTILLHDGRIIRLSSLYFPDLSIDNSGDLSVLAKNILNDMLLGKTVQIYQSPDKNWGRMNRMGHDIAHLVRQPDQSWVQGVLLSLGLAQVQTTQRTPELEDRMYELETNARAEKIGVWEKDNFNIRTPDDAESYMDSFQIVEGTIASVALKNNRVYLNFGTDWRKDFTVSISSANKQLFIKQGYDPFKWNKKTVRVRGWIRDYNGPFMEIDHPQAIELIE